MVSQTGRQTGGRAEADHRSDVEYRSDSLVYEYVFETTMTSQCDSNRTYSAAVHSGLFPAPPPATPLCNNTPSHVKYKLEYVIISSLTCSE